MGAGPETPDAFSAPHLRFQLAHVRGITSAFIKITSWPEESWHGQQIS